jgi:hypothetical protein
MVRLFFLVLSVIALGATAADAGIIGFAESIPQPSIASMELVELAQAGDEADDPAVVELDGQACSWAVTKAHGGIAHQLALCEGVVLRGRQPSVGRVVTSNRFLPPSPVLEGLLKPA